MRSAKDQVADMAKDFHDLSFLDVNTDRGRRLSMLPAPAARARFACLLAERLYADAIRQAKFGTGDLQSTPVVVANNDRAVPIHTGGNSSCISSNTGNVFGIDANGSDLFVRFNQFLQNHFHTPTSLSSSSSSSMP
jgi:hypothetical protein